jgi:hypothetical protein
LFVQLEPVSPSTWQGVVAWPHSSTSVLQSEPVQPVVQVHAATPVPVLQLPP